MAFIYFLLLAATAYSQTRSIPADGFRDWRVNGGPDNIRYSTLTQINRNNAHQLEVAWSFDTGDAYQGSEMQVNPIIVNGVLYATTPKLRVIALDAATGHQKWAYDPNEGARPSHRRNRGVTYWTDGKVERIFFGFRTFIYALDARTGTPAEEFGTKGKVDLREGLGRQPDLLNVTSTTPGVAYKDLIIWTSLVSEDLPSAPGDIRAFDARTGKIRWTFHTIPRPGEFGYNTWPKDAWKHTGGANTWAGMSVDHKRGLVFVPTGSASSDFYGADRHGNNLFANCLIALKADTGKRVWHFQMFRHDIWDRDLPAPPSLVRVLRDGKFVDAVAQVTKSGQTFVFDRDSGKPLFPIEEIAAPPSSVDGEQAAKMQPVPVRPPAFARQSLTENDLTQRTPEAHRYALEVFRKSRNRMFEAPSHEGTVIFPGFDGGGEWGGQAFDPETGLFYVNSNEMAWILKLVPRPIPGTSSGGKALYEQACANCHKADRSGSPPEFPALANLEGKLTEQEIVALTRSGKGRMPAFESLGSPAVRAIARYVLTGKDTPPAHAALLNTLKYTHDGYNKFLDPEGYPAIAPPWGTLNAIDLDKGEIRWKIPFGEFPELVEKGIRNTGSENYGGPVVTAGGLVFIGATNHDRKFHVFDKLTGKLLWETTLPAAGNATPATYEIAGRQYVVIACGGGKSGRPSGGTYVAFALPKK